MATSRLEAYGMLAHHALGHIYYTWDKEYGVDGTGCCPKCCAPCGALQYLDNEGILDEVIKNWDVDNNGAPILENGDPSWWMDGKVDRKWLYAAWEFGPLRDGCH